MTAQAVPLLALSGNGDQLLITGSRHGSPGDTELVELVIDVVAHPFAGQVRQTVLVDDLRFFAENLRRMSLPGEVALGGERMLELTLAVEPQSPGPGIVVEVSLAPHGDDPYPSIRFLLFDQQPFGAKAADDIDAFLSAHM
ncbi:MAG: hypothetical protein ABIZ07_08470 [Dermatophilaceae bacterium]